MKTILIKMTDAYEHQNFYKNINDLEVVDFTGVEGTRCYCDDLACATIREKLSGFGPAGIHFIDSGNYHYLSLFWLEKIDEDFSLILFDHHPDDQPPSFGDILSCGGWVKEAKDKLPRLKNVYTFGVGEMPDPAKIDSTLPLFISIDKDVLAEEFAITDWDQGYMTLDEMRTLLDQIIPNHHIIGIDICGDSSSKAIEGSLVNNQTNSFLFDFLSANF